MNFKLNPLFIELLSLNLPTKDYAIFGSGPMYPRGLREEIHDLDIIARGSAWDQVLSLKNPDIPNLGNDKVVNLFGDHIEIFNRWMSRDWDVDDLIDSADVIEGIRFVSLNNVLKWKKQMNRPKDILDIEKIEKYLKLRK